MVKYRIIGCMTGNSMDAIDLVLTEFDNDKMTDVYTFSKPYKSDMVENMKVLREEVFEKKGDEIVKNPKFVEIHNKYIQGVANAIDEMCRNVKLNKKDINAIGFHGKTLDHNPPSRASKNGTKPYTLQIGSGAMLADLTGIKVVYDFRSSFIMNGKEGAPLVGRHNLNVAKIEGDGVFFNGGNTSNFAVIKEGKIVFQTDVGPFNEYVDMYVRSKKGELFDKNGMFGKKGKLKKRILAKLFEIGKDFYDIEGEKSGDPQYYYSNKVLDYLEKSKANEFDIIYTLEYFSAYLGVRELLRCDVDFDKIRLFGGGWKNPVIRLSFIKLLEGKGEVLKDDIEMFNKFWSGNRKIDVADSRFGEFMEARLMADMARYKLENMSWDMGIISGEVAEPKKGRKVYFDYVNKASKGWNE